MELDRAIYRGRRKRKRCEVRNIADDLKERIAAVENDIVSVRFEYDSARRDLEELYVGRHGRATAKLKALQLLLEEEDGLLSPPISQASVHSLKLPMQDFIVNCLSTVGPKTKESIREQVERAGYGSANDGVGRTVHTTLLNLVKYGKILRSEAGVYEAVKIKPLRPMAPPGGARP